MNNYQFKAGDKVYFPKVSTKVFTLKKSSNNRGYPLLIEYGSGGFDDFTLYGHLNAIDSNSSLFLATEENRLLLNQLYGIEFDKSVSKDSIIQNNINIKGFCLCLASNYEIKRISNIKNLKQTLEVITEIISDIEHQYTSNNTCWKYAEPIEINSNGAITYLADN